MNWRGAAPGRKSAAQDRPAQRPPRPHRRCRADRFPLSAALRDGTARAQAVPPAIQGAEAEERLFLHPPPARRPENSASRQKKTERPVNRMAPRAGKLRRRLRVFQNVGVLAGTYRPNLDRPWVDLNPLPVRRYPERIQRILPNAKNLKRNNRLPLARAETRDSGRSVRRRAGIARSNRFRANPLRRVDQNPQFNPIADSVRTGGAQYCRLNAHLLRGSAYGNARDAPQYKPKTAHSQLVSFPSDGSERDAVSVSSSSA